MERHLEHSELDFHWRNSLPIEQNDDFFGGQAENLHKFDNTQEPLQFRVDAGIEGYSITVAPDQSRKAYHLVYLQYFFILCLYVCKYICVCM